MATPVKFQGEVVEISRHSTDVVTYEFRYVGLRPRYRPGQFVHLALDPFDPSRHWPESRAFTIAKGPTDRDLIRLTIAAKGSFTRRIVDELEVGRIVWMKGPYGKFIVQDSADADAILIAGGTGVTPFVAFMEDALVKGIVGSVCLHYGTRDPDLLTFRSLAEQCVRELTKFQAHYYSENGKAEGVTQGQMSIDTIVAGIDDVPRSVFYLCGPEQMVEAFSSRLTGEFGVSAEHVRIDEWG